MPKAALCSGLIRPARNPYVADDIAAAPACRHLRRRYSGFMTPGSLFHPAVAAWFERSFAAPTAAQAQAWPAFPAGRHVLIAAPTGSGKTLAALLAALDRPVRQRPD